MQLRHLFSLLITGYCLPLFAAGGQPASPTWPATVAIIEPGDTPAQITSKIGFARSNGLAGIGGSAILFKPGSYSGLLITIDPYESILGMGDHPTNTTINEVRALQLNDSPSSDPCVGALDNHWKAVENFITTPTTNAPNTTLSGMVWAVSQGCMMRKLIVNGRLFLSETVARGPNFFEGASTGAFIADSSFLPITSISGPVQEFTVSGGSQRQSLLRNVFMGNPGRDASGNLLPAWVGGLWSQIFVGCNKFSNSVPTCGNCGTLFTTDTSALTYAAPGCTCQNSFCCASSTTGCSSLSPETANNNPCTGTAKTIVDTTPLIAEKPFITFSGGTYYLNIPRNETNKQGTTSNFLTYTVSTDSTQIGMVDVKVPFTNVYVATPTDTASTINAQFAAGNHVVLTPGLYKIDSFNPIKIDNPNLVLLGIGFPILVGTQTNGENLIQVGNVSGVRIAGIIFTNTNTPANISNGAPADLLAKDCLQYLVWGTGVAEGSSVQSGFLYDCFANLYPVRGDSSQWNNSGAAKEVTDTILKINSANIVCDNVWLARNSTLQISNPTDLFSYNNNGAQILGNNAIAYGMSCDNAFGDLLKWFGNNGKCYSFMGTMAVDQQEDTALVNSVYKYCGYHVNDVANETVSRFDTTTFSAVTHHQGFGVSVYSNFLTAGTLNQTLRVNTGINSPQTSVSADAIHFTNSSTRFLGGTGGISSVINGAGFNVGGGSGVCILAPGPSYVCNSDGTPVKPVLNAPSGACP